VAISVTWPNIFKLTALATVVLSAVLSGGLAIFERRLDDRMTLYQLAQTQQNAEIDRLTDRVRNLEQAR
jgi:CHASE1-domain containing sensor protein